MTPTERQRTYALGLQQAREDFLDSLLRLRAETEHVLDAVESGQVPDRPFAPQTSQDCVERLAAYSTLRKQAVPSGLLTPEQRDLLCSGALGRPVDGAVFDPSSRLWADPVTTAS